MYKVQNVWWSSEALAMPIGQKIKSPTPFTLEDFYPLDHDRAFAKSTYTGHFLHKTESWWHFWHLASLSHISSGTVKGIQNISLPLIILDSQSLDKNLQHSSCPLLTTKVAYCQIFPIWCWNNGTNVSSPEERENVSVPRNLLNAISTSFTLMIC